MRCLERLIPNLALTASLVLIALASQAAFAADYQIAFRQTGEPYPIVVMEADGSNQTVVYEGGGPPAVSWSPDGKSLAFLDYQEGILRIDGIDQGSFNPEATLVVPSVGACVDDLGTRYEYSFIGNPRWSTVADEIAFTAAGNGFEVLCVAPASGGSPEFVTEDLFSGWRLAWNADGTQIAFMGDDAILNLVDRATGSIVDIFDPPVIDGQVDDTWFNLDWARNGDPRIAFQTSGFRNTWIYTLDTGTGEFSEKLVFGNQPSWSPDNSQLVFNNPKGGGGWGRISLFTFATGQVEDLTSGGGGRPDWRYPQPTCSDSSDCDDGNPCTDDDCDTIAGLCTHQPNFDPCDDGNECTYSDGCDSSGLCVGTPYADGLSCSTGAGHCCGGQCTQPACEFNSQCDDGDFCTIDTCDSSVACAASCQYEPSSDPSCQCLPKGDSCSTSDECCSGQCHPVKGTCK